MDDRYEGGFAENTESAAETDQMSGAGEVSEQTALSKEEIAVAFDEGGQNDG